MNSQSVSTYFGPAPTDGRQASRPTNPWFALHVSGQGRAAIVRLEGEARIAANGTMEIAFMRLTARRASLVVLDLSELTFLSSLAMGALVGLRRDLGRWGGRVRIAAVPPAIRKALEMAGLSSLFEIFGTVNDALADL